MFHDGLLILGSDKIINNSAAHKGHLKFIKCSCVFHAVVAVALSDFDLK